MASDPGVTGTARTLEDPLAESLRLVEVADKQGLTLRLMGGMAVRAHAPRWPARTRRREVDLDFATTSKDRSAIYKLLETEGYTPDRQQNALFGQKQAYFVDVPRRRPVDVSIKGGRRFRTREPFAHRSKVGLERHVVVHAKNEFGRVHGFAHRR